MGPGDLKLSEDDNTVLEARQDGHDLLVCWRDDGSSGSGKTRPSLYLTESCLGETGVHKQVLIANAMLSCQGVSA